MSAAESVSAECRLTFAENRQSAVDSSLNKQIVFVLTIVDLVFQEFLG